MICVIVNKNVIDYINSLEKELPDHLRELEESAIKGNVPIIKKETQSLLRFLLRLLEPKDILEIGTAIGFSAIFMSEYMPVDSTITTIEKLEIRLEQARANLRKSLKSNQITLLEGDAFDILKELARDRDRKFDFIFLDAAKGQYLNFLPSILDLLTSKGILITDNVLQDGSIAGSRYAIKRRDRTIHVRMREYLYTLKRTPGLETVIIPLGDGVAITKKTNTL